MAIFPLRTSFRDSLFNIAPPRLRGKWGERFLYMIGAPLDAIADTLREGVKARMPGVGTTTALPDIGKDRVIMRGFAETDEAYAARLSRAFDDWSIAGSPVAVITQLLGYVSPVVPRIRYVCNGACEAGLTTFWLTIEADQVSIHREFPQNWDWDGKTDELARFWLILYPGVWALKYWDDGHFWNDGTLWGLDADPNMPKDLRRVVSTFKAGGSMCVNIILAANDGDFDPTTPAGGMTLPSGDWDRPYRVLAGVASPTRIPAVYLPGT